ncbi:hypothetical protein IV203_005444 [Nitzschia inconspicua]|uniref:Uncharacterized protein n=1 Tax=Nitzschia inconspicua TaxID=303405 RepID=A0A9K3PGY4_9STRA|nr:hypothetical protein IV203_005444 [Nitzschia inconspicua]
MKLLSPAILLATTVGVSAFQSSFVARPNKKITVPSRSSSSGSLKMLDGNVAAGVAIGVAGFAFGIGMVAFAEAQGERAKERGGGLSDSMSTQLSGMLLEDVEVSSVEDLGSLTSQLEAALKASGGTTDEELVMTEEEKKRLQEEADDGW